MQVEIVELSFFLNVKLIGNKLLSFLYFIFNIYKESMIYVKLIFDGYIHLAVHKL